MTRANRLLVIAFAALLLTGCAVFYHTPGGGLVVIHAPGASTPQVTPTSTWQAATYTPTPAITLETNPPRPTWTPASTDVTPTQEDNTPGPTLEPTIVFTQLPPTFTPEPTSNRGVACNVTAIQWNVRSGPGLSNPVVDALPPFDCVEIDNPPNTDVVDGWRWVQIFQSGLPGWVVIDRVDCSLVALNLSNCIAN